MNIFLIKVADSASLHGFLVAYVITAICLLQICCCFVVADAVTAACLCKDSLLWILLMLLLLFALNGSN